MGIRWELDFVGLYLLSIMRVLAAGVDFQLFHNLAAEAVMRDHAGDGTLDDQLGAAKTEFLDRFALLTPNVAGVRRVNFLPLLVPGQANLIGVDNHHEVTAIEMGSEQGLVFPAEKTGSSDRDLTEHLVLGIDDIPFAVNFFSFGRKRFHFRE